MHLLEHGYGEVEPTGRPVRHGEAVAASERVGVFWPERCLAKLEHTLEQPDRLGGAAGTLVGVGEAVAGGHRGGMLGSDAASASLSAASSSTSASGMRPALQ